MICSNNKVYIDGNEINKNKFVIKKNRSRISKYKILVKLNNYDFLFKSKNISLKIIRLRFQIVEARLVFIKLRQIFVKASIFHYYNPEYYIYIKINLSGYAMNEVFS